MSAPYPTAPPPPVTGYPSAPPASSYGGQFAPPPPAAHATRQISLADRVKEVSEKLDLEQAMVNDLLGWVGTEVIVIADDSGSMRQIASGGPGMRPMTRW